MTPEGMPNRLHLPRRVDAALARPGLEGPVERRFAGRMSGVLYLTGALTAFVFPLLPGGGDVHRGAVYAMAAAALAWALASLLLVRWERCGAWVVHTSNLAAVPLVASVVAASGGADSPAQLFWLYIVVFAAFFHSAPVAALYFAAVVAGDVLPLAYDDGAVDGGFLATLLVTIPSFAVVATAIGIGKGILLEHRRQARELADEQAALRRVATAVAAGEPEDQIHALVARELSELFGGTGAGTLRFTGDGEAVVVGSMSEPPKQSYPPGTRVSVRPGSNIERMLATDRPVRVDDHAPDEPARRAGYRCSVIAPVRVHGAIWGFLTLAAAAPASLPADAERRLTAFGDVLATAVLSLEDRRRLAAQASTDPLTGLANHRAFHERLEIEAARALRHGRPLSVALLDIDRFKAFNDARGHAAGDHVLTAVAGELAALSRAEDCLARVGGDEIAWLLPEIAGAEAASAAERARQRIEELRVDGRRITVSIGVCDVTAAGDAESLLRLADGALYWSKAHGRNAVQLYDPGVVVELSAEERARQLERTQALTGLRALARAIDAKDPTTRRHSERVASLVARLATASDWPPERVRRLREAALVHDVGKIGIPDAVLLKDGPLTAEEYDLVKTHATLSAEIVDGVLDDEQVQWILGHHERPDGRGYPAGLHEDEISEGAALLAVADAFDVMTVSRPYSVPKRPKQALAECRALVGEQFTEAAVRALEASAAAGAGRGRRNAA
jgi:diguanylate cyclase (GGDEF)-like protein